MEAVSYNTIIQGTRTHICCDGWWVWLEWCVMTCLEDFNFLLNSCACMKKQVILNSGYRTNKLSFQTLSQLRGRSMFLLAVGRLLCTTLKQQTLQGIDPSLLTTSSVFWSLWNFLVGFEVGKNTEVELTLSLFLFPLGSSIDPAPTNAMVLMCGVKIAWVPTLTQWTSNTSRSNNKKVCPLNVDQMRVPVFWGCPLWAMVCWMNTRSVCRICQINFNSERIWAVNTQEIAWLVLAWSVIQGAAGGGWGSRGTGGKENVSRKWNYLF